MTGLGEHGGGAELWVGDDPMRSCVPCMEGDHRACLDLIMTPPYGVHACGCTNPVHEEAER